MADEELSTILNKRCKIIEEDEIKNSQDSKFITNNSSHDNIHPNNSPGYPQNIRNPSIKPSLPPKPKLEKHALEQIGKHQNNRSADASSSSPAVVMKAPIKPPRLFVKPKSEKNSEFKVINTSELPRNREEGSINHRLIDEDDNNNEESWRPVFKVWNPYIEFKEMTRAEIHKYQEEFKKYDKNADKLLDVDELKMMMEKMGLPQTHIAIKSIMKEVDEDKDNMISFREFLLIFKKAKNNYTSEDSCLFDLYKHPNEIDVDKEGVGKAKDFFETKMINLTRESRFEEEIKEETKQKKTAQEESKRKKALFNETVKMFERKQL